LCSTDTYAQLMREMACIPARVTQGHPHTKWLGASASTPPRARPQPNRPGAHTLSQTSMCVSTTWAVPLPCVHPRQHTIRGLHGPTSARALLRPHERAARAMFGCTGRRDTRNLYTSTDCAPQTCGGRCSRPPRIRRSVGGSSPPSSSAAARVEGSWPRLTQRTPPAA